MFDNAKGQRRSALLLTLCLALATALSVAPAQAAADARAGGSPGATTQPSCSSSSACFGSATAPGRSTGSTGRSRPTLSGGFRSQTRSRPTASLVVLRSASSRLNRPRSPAWCGKHSAGSGRGGTNPGTWTGCSGHAQWSR